MTFQSKWTETVILIYLRQAVFINARFNPLFQSTVQLLGILDLIDEGNEYKTVSNQKK